MRLTRRVLWGLLGSLVLLACWFRPDLPPAFGQGVGIYSRASCTSTTITSPQGGETWCFDIAGRRLMVWDGAQFVAVTASASGGTFTAVGGQTNFGSYLFFPVATGTTQQTGLGAQITGAATGTATNRIAGYFGAQTSDTGTDTPTGLNVVVQHGANAFTVQMIGEEIDVNSNKANATLDMSPSMVGMSVVSAGTKRAGVAYLVSGTPKWVDGFQVGQGAIDTGFWAFRYRGDGATGGPWGVRADGAMELGFSASAIGSANELHMLNNKDIQGLDSTGTVLKSMIKITAGNNVGIDSGANGTTFGGGVTIGGATGGIMGATSLNVASATFMNGLANQVASGSGVNLANVRGLSGAASSTLSNNLRGTCVFAAANTCLVTFANNEVNANYFVMVGGPVVISAKSTTGFRMDATATNSNAVDWLLVR